MTLTRCFCGSLNTFKECCEPYIYGTHNVPTALALMQSRYSAYATLQAAYLMETTHISERKHYSKSDILQWAASNKWQKLEIITATENTVEFKAYFLDSKLQNQIHHELSTFKLENGSWFYVDGKFF
ncbi:SEC-C motif-containing protein [Flavobacterium sp. CG_23.5]|uniref:YchJ family protein n=1 Tax=Flavobacterium sp. CG_23.5 TaxID=2760708 RepID=UPI001AE686FD|nr:YchJ family metal-binding protein [Flavobacterium sp. CG_23.5]MBP2282242.1 SEC-C motif-containing protein [Flavobacterium sp. CG_23.5]